MLCDRGCLLLETEPHSPARNASKSDTVYSELVENNPDAFNEQPDPDPAIPVPKSHTCIGKCIGIAPFAGSINI